MPSNPPLDHKAILGWVHQGSAVLDLGCGDGELLTLLVEERHVRAQGIEIDEQAIYQCVAKGLSVFHEDIDNGLSDYADRSFDYVILNQTFQQVKSPDLVLKEALRVGWQVIVGFPNFAYYLARLRMFFEGKAPVTPSLPYAWNDTPNLHFLSILDFIEYCSRKEIKIRDSVFIAQERNIRLFPNLFALKGIFLVSDGGTNDTN
ncbi:MAG TPA: methionine biosynthesis protein MetW [Thermodesulfobacteriota bacterium]|nr:methionine biosynthesis protein MetW [Thermodesulfobacteriota bacterium]